MDDVSRRCLIVGWSVVVLETLLHFHSLIDPAVVLDHVSFPLLALWAGVTMGTIFVWDRGTILDIRTAKSGSVTNGQV
jgi:hypothetical protein